MKTILKAINFATAKHQGQMRRGTGQPYITHPISVSYLVAQYKKSKHLESLIAAALLHDTLEDTETTFAELATEFSPLVASLVAELTSDEEEISKLGKNEYLKRKMVGISSYALVLKLVDRLHNILDNPRPKYVRDTVELMQHVKTHRNLSSTQKRIVEDVLTQCAQLTSSASA